MKKSLLAILVFAMTVVTANTAKAELLIEPLVGWTFDQHLDLQKNYSSGNGLSYGGRLGFQKIGFSGGLDFLQTQVDMGSNDFDKNLKTTEWAAFVGYRFPILFKVYAGYIFEASADTNLNSQSVTLDDGTGGKVGVGTTILPFLDLNLEYRKGTYNTAKVAGLKLKDQDFEAWMLSVSVPITLF